MIPDTFTDVNAFRFWLPDEEGHFVQRPYFSVRAKCSCWKCGKETPVVGLGAKRVQSLVYETEDKPVWREEEGPFLYTEIDHMDEEIARVMQSNYPFFKKIYSKTHEHDLWGNCCVHCQALQEEDGDYIFGCKSPFAPTSVEEAMEIRIVYFKLEFDYFISAGYALNTLYFYLFE